MSLDLLHHFYTEVSPNPRVLDLCGVRGPGTPYSAVRDDDLTVVINGWARPEYLPLIWEAIQYQTRRPRETWLVQNDPAGRAPVPRAFFDDVRPHSTVVLDSGLNHGCWFRFLLAALYCRTRYVAVFDDDTLPGCQALAAALEALERKPGIYGGRGMTFRNEGPTPRFSSCDQFGWPVGTPEITEVDFVGHMWVTETRWLRALFRQLPERLFDSPEPGRECGEDMYLSFVAQRHGLPTFVYAHGQPCNPRWSSLQAYEMGIHRYAMSCSNGLSAADHYLERAVSSGWRLLRFA
jgi:hypothetical protein